MKIGKKNIVLLLLAFLINIPLWADTFEDGVNLDEIVVAGSRWTQNRDLQPIKISRLGFEESNQYNPQTAADLLNISGEVFIQKSQYGGGSPMIRGFATNRLLYSVDGVRMNTAIYRAGNIQNVISLDPFAIGSSEILFGPGAVGYGSDAIGGVMIFNTLKTKLSVADTPLVYGSATLRTATASTEFTGHAHVGVGFKKWGFVTSFTYSNFNDLKQGTHGPEDYIKQYNVQPNYVAGEGVNDIVTLNSDKRKQTPSGYNQFNVMQKLRYTPAENWNLEYAFHYSETSDYARYDRHLRMRNGQPRYAEWNYGPQKWMMNQLVIENIRKTVMYDSLKVNAAFQIFEESRISRDLNKPTRETQSERVDAWSATIDFRKQILSNLSLFYGAEYIQNNVKSTGEGLNVVTNETSVIASRYPTARWYSAGVYAQTEWQATRTLNLEAGVRYNHYLINSDFSTAGYEVPFNVHQKSDAGSVSANVGLNWRPKYGWLMRLNYARGFRAPNVDDMGKLFDSVDGYITVPNPNLKPEYADNVELGLAKKFGRYLQLDITGYYTHLNNAIVRRNSTFNGQETMIYQGEECRVQSLQNAAVANVWGIQAGVSAEFAKWFYFNTRLNYQKGREEMDNGEKSPSRHAAPFFGKAALGFKHNKATVEVYTQFQAECSAENMPEEEKEKTEIYALDENGNAYSPAWITLNLRASYNVYKGLYLNATLENITDSRYRPYSSGISAAGRNFTISATYSF